MDLKTLTNRADRFLNAANNAPRQTMPFIMAKDDDTTEIFIYDVIGGFFGLSAQELVKDIAEIETKNIVLRINSPGGGVFDGISIYNALVNHPARVTTQIDGLAASIASTIAEAGEEIHMNLGSMFMIHKPLMFGGGNADDFRALADLLDKAEESIVDIFRTKVKIPRDDIQAAMKAETWFSAEEALDAGYVTSITEAEAVENRFNLSAIFENVPEDMRIDPTVRDVEKTLRDSGVSRRTAERMAVAAIATLNSKGEPSGEDQGEPELRASIDRLTEMFST